jgi:uncharacterized caspase-like protein
MRKSKSAASVFVIAALIVFSPIASRAQQGAEPRLALVIGNSQYRTSPLATAANDAGLIAQTLTTAGFDVTGAADLDQDSLRRAFRDFLTKVQAAGPNAVTFVYLAGYGLQYSGDNYFVPVDASLARDTDIPVEALRVSDFTSALAGLPLQARIFVLDAARANPFPSKGNPLAGGLALVDVEANSLDAFNAAPGTIAPAEKGPYGAYARALAEMLRYGGVPIDEAFARTRLRVNELTRGSFVPWDVSKLTHPLVLLAGNPEAPPPPAMQNFAAMRSRPIRDFPTANEAYAAAVEIDTLSAYQEFLSAYGSDPLAGRVRALLAARREALTWNRTVIVNTPDAYWSYMRRYPRGPHYFDARRRLGPFSVSLEPPPRFNVYDFQGLPPPPDDEYVIVDRPALFFDGPDYAPAPPPPPEFLPPPPAEFRRLPPPEQGADGVLPALGVLALPFARPAQRPGSISQPNLVPASGGAPPSGAPGGPHPNGGRPNAQPGQPTAPQGAPARAPLATPQVQPNQVQPNAVAPLPHAPAPAGASPQAVPAAPPGNGHPPHPKPATPPGTPPAPPQAAPNVVAPQARPQTVAPPVAPPHAEPPHPTPQVAAPHPAAPPHAEPPRAPAPPPPPPTHVAPPAPPPPAPPPPAPHVEPPHPAPPPAAAPAAPPPPKASPKPGEPKPGEKKEEKKEEQQH